MYVDKQFFFATTLINGFLLFSGGIDRDGYPLLIFYDAGVDCSAVENGEFLKLIEYLCSITR